MRHRHLLACASLNLAAAMLLAPPLGAQSSGAPTGAAGTTVSGVVRDSISHLPLAGATVQLVAPDSVAGHGRSAISDSVGRFTLTDVRDGRYALGFYHPLLDSLGVEPPAREVRVEEHQPVRIDLATPSTERIRAAVCGARSQIGRAHV